MFHDRIGLVSGIRRSTHFDGGWKNSHGVARLHAMARGVQQANLGAVTSWIATFTRVWAWASLVGPSSRAWRTWCPALASTRRRSGFRSATYIVRSSPSRSRAFGGERHPVRRRRLGLGVNARRDIARPRSNHAV
jgi:hypothetical protein